MADWPPLNTPLVQILAANMINHNACYSSTSQWRINYHKERLFHVWPGLMLSQTGASAAAAAATTTTYLFLSWIGGDADARWIRFSPPGQTLEKFLGDERHERMDESKADIQTGVEDIASNVLRRIVLSI